MDLLFDLFHQSGLRRRLLDLSRLPSDVALRFPCERSIGFHVVTRGRVWVHAPDLAEPLALSAGDVALMARGCEHVVAPSASLRGLSSRVMRAADSADERMLGEPPVDGGPIDDRLPEPGASLISGAYQLWNAPMHPFFGQLPAWHVVRSDQMPRLGPLSLTVALLGQEAARREPGADLVLHGLLDVLFTYLMRDMLARHAPDAGFSRAQRDPPVRRAVTLMHADCAHPWTLDELAHQVGLSRTGLAERFRQAMGDTPLSYLRTVRLQKAMRLLSETDQKLEAVAAEVGYQDAFAFSKAFKRLAGVAPREFRQRDAAERHSPWRFGAADALGALPGLRAV